MAGKNHNILGKCIKKRNLPTADTILCWIRRFRGNDPSLLRLRRGRQLRVGMMGKENGRPTGQRRGGQLRTGMTTKGNYGLL
jgi:hypothetical protein